MEWKGIFDLSLTGIIAVLTLIIAFRQYWIQRYRVKIDLFDRRMKVYDSIRDTLICIRSDASTKNINHFEFYSSISNGRFLFDKKLNSYLKEIKEKVVDLELYSKELTLQALPGNRREYVVTQEYETIKWLCDQLSIFEDRFAEYMEINKV